MNKPEKDRSKSLINRPIKSENEPITPADLVNAVFHGDKKALLHSLGRRKKKAQHEKLMKEMKEGKVRHRTFKRGSSGVVSMQETIKGSL